MQKLLRFAQKLFQWVFLYIYVVVCFLFLTSQSLLTALCFSVILWFYERTVRRSFTPYPLKYACNKMAAGSVNSQYSSLHCTFAISSKCVTFSVNVLNRQKPVKLKVRINCANILTSLFVCTSIRLGNPNSNTAF